MRITPKDRKTPVKLKPALKTAIWAGNRLKAEYGKKTADLEKISESWELSCHREGKSEIASGPFKGKSLEEYIKGEQPSMLGERCKGLELPILVKYIDAGESLSVQVHPDDSYGGLEPGEAGKNEMWYIMDAEPGAEIILGLRAPLSRDAFLEAAWGGDILNHLCRLPVQKGDVFFIPAGTIHAMGKGILAAEIQQSSDTTYRVFDYGRLGADGKPRPLHIEKATESALLSPSKTKCEPKRIKASLPGGFVTELLSCPWFTVERLELTGDFHSECGPESFKAVLCLGGEAELKGEGGSVSLSKGETAFLPAGMGHFTLSGKGEFLFVRL